MMASIGVCLAFASVALPWFAVQSGVGVSGRAMLFTRNGALHIALGKEIDDGIPF